MLTVDERKRYDRQIMMPEVGEEGQEKLKQAKVLIAGAGGLGSPISIYLAAAGIGHIRLVDHDQIELTNLNRQVLHWNRDIGEFKVKSALNKLNQLNPDVAIEIIKKTIEEGNIRDIVNDCDAIVDAMDNLETRYLLNKIAIEKNIPFFHGAVRGLEGRAMTIIPGKSPCLRCMYHGTLPPEKFPVIGVAPGVIGCIQATEVIKYFVGMGELLTGRLLVYDGMSLTFREFKITRNPQCDHCGQRKEV
ncbi:MAG: HesA/MoeB/ThiF family protein [Deltaproteobacteria bacterium]|nr:HesA/MoeB/ThiF family protein [Deltaproteobacteria bacterium]